MDFFVISLAIGCMFFAIIYEVSLENIFENIIFQYGSYVGYAGMFYHAIKYFLGKISNNSFGKLFLLYIKSFEGGLKINVNLENIEKNKNKFSVQYNHDISYPNQVPKRANICKDESQNILVIKQLVKREYKYNKNINILNKVFNVKENLPKENRIQNKKSINERQRKDIDILRDVIKNTENIQVEKSDIKNTIIIIGQLMKNLSYKNNDIENICIRNKYGFIRRNKNKIINKNGIHFETFVRFGIILEKNSYNISNRVNNNIELELKNLEVKISNVINMVETCENKIEDTHLSIPTVLEITSKHYPILLFNKMKAKLMELKEIDFSNKDDRYHFAHVFVYIGECACEINEDPILKERYLNSSEYFKIFTKIRHKLLHDHCRLIKINNAENNFPNEKIQYILKYFSEFINNNSNNNDDNNNNDFSQLQFDKDFNEAIKSIEIYLMKSNSQKRKTSIRSIYISHICIRQIFKLKQFNKTDQNKTNKNRSNNRKRKIKLIGKYKKSIEIKIDKIHFPNKNIIVRNVNSFDHINSQSKPHDQDRKFMETLSKIIDELIHYTKIQKNTNTKNLRKRRSIILHIITVCGQHFIDSKIDFTTYQLSELIIEAKEAIINSRNDGLAHNPIFLNETIVLKRLRDDILPATSHLKALYFINSIDVITKDSIVELIESFVMLGLFDSAIDLLKTVINDYDDLNLYFYLAYVYKLRENYTDSYKIYEILFLYLQDLDPDEIPDNYKQYFSEQYKRIAHSRAMLHQYKEAIDCCYKGEMILNDVGFKIDQANYLFNDGQNKEAWNLVQDIIENMVMDPTDRFEILYLKALLIENILNKDEILVSFDQCLVEIEKTYKNNIYCFKKRFNDQYIRAIIIILNLKVEQFILKMKLEKSFCYTTLYLLVDEYNKININNPIGLFQWIVKLHIAFRKAVLLLYSQNGNDFSLKPLRLNHVFDNEIIKGFAEIENYGITYFMKIGIYLIILLILFFI